MSGSPDSHTDPPPPTATLPAMATMDSGTTPTPPPFPEATLAAMGRGGGVYFGTRWHAPAFAEAIEVATPVGATCLFCTETVEAGDSGTLTPYATGQGHAGVEAVHIECWLRSILGCVSHLKRECSCYGGTSHEGHTRADARAVMAWLLTHPTT